MKVILSKKGFDSQYGKKPSIVLPNKKMVSFPIPVENETGVKSNQINIDNVKLSSYFSDLGISTEMDHHLDPMIQEYGYNLGYGAFGQCGAALKHLQNCEIDVGDLFLFYGTFSFTSNIDGKLSYDPMHPFHAIWGYLIVDDYIKTDDIEDIPNGKYNKLISHPHYINRYNKMYNKNNQIYIGNNYGIFKYSDKLMLTKKGYNKTYWELPNCFCDIHMTYNDKSKLIRRYSDRYEVYVIDKAQEFVFKSNIAVENWINGILNQKISN